MLKALIGEGEHAPQTVTDLRQPRAVVSERVRVPPAIRDGGKETIGVEGIESMVARVAQDEIRAALHNLERDFARPRELPDAAGLLKRNAPSLPRNHVHAVAVAQQPPVEVGRPVVGQGGLRQRRPAQAGAVIAVEGQRHRSAEVQVRALVHGEFAGEEIDRVEKLGRSRRIGRRRFRGRRRKDLHFQGEAAARVMRRVKPAERDAGLARPHGPEGEDPVADVGKSPLRQDPDHIRVIARLREIERQVALTRHVRRDRVGEDAADVAAEFGRAAIMGVQRGREVQEDE